MMKPKEDINNMKKKRDIRKHKNERRDSPAEQQGDIATSCPGATQRRKNWGEGDGRWVWSKQWHAQPHLDLEEYVLRKGDGKLASAQDRTPSRGEPGEPRGLTTFQRTPSPKPGGKRQNRRQRKQKRKEPKERNKKRNYN